MKLLYQLLLIMACQGLNFQCLIAFFPQHRIPRSILQKLQCISQRQSLFSCRQQLKDLVSVFLFFKFIFTGRFVLFHFHVICLGVIRQAVIDHLLRLLNYNTLVQKTGYMSLRLLALCYQFQTIIIIIMEQAYCRMLLSLRPIHKDPVQINPQPLFLSTIFSMIVLSQPMPYFTWPNWLSF